MRNPYQRKAASKSHNSSPSAKNIYQQFIENMVAQGSVSALYQDGWALCATPTGQRAFAITDSIFKKGTDHHFFGLNA